MALQWETDRGLQVRMALALVLVAVLPVAFVYSFVLLMNTVGIELFEFATERPWRGRFYVEPWLVVGAVVDEGGTAWRVSLDEPEPFDPAFGPFVAGNTVVLGSPGEVRGYWRSQLRR